MLQITICHSENTVRVADIKDTSSLQILSEFDDNTKKISLEPLKNHIGEKVMISHYNYDKKSGQYNFDDEYVRTLTNVGVDSDNLEYFEYN